MKSKFMKMAGWALVTLLGVFGAGSATAAADSFVWKIYDSSHRVKDNYGNNYNGTMYLVCFGPTYAGYPSENQGPAYKYVITPFMANPGEGLDLDNMAQPGSEWPKVVKQVEVVDGLMTVDGAPVDGVTVDSDPAYWYRPIFFCPTRVQNPPAGYELDMWRCSFTATPKNMGRDGVYYFTHPKDYYYDVNHLKDSNISTYYYNSFAGPGKLKKAEPETGDAMLTAKLAWAQNFGPQGSGITGTGTFFARLEIACTNDWASTLTSVRFVFQDRVLKLTSSTMLAAQLYDSTAPAGPISTAELFGGETFRRIDLNLAKIKGAAKNAFVRFGPASVDPAVTGYVVEMEDRAGTPEMNNVSRDNPSVLETHSLYAELPDWQKYCWLVWETNGHTYSMPVSSASGVSGETVAGGVPVPAKVAANVAPKMFFAASAEPIVAAPWCFWLSVALDVPILEMTEPACRITEFSMTDDQISGRIVTMAGEEESVPSVKYSTVKLLGTAKLGDEFVVISEITTDEEGRFTLKRPEGYAFFRLSVDLGSKLVNE